ELAYLAADGRHHIEQLLVGLPDLMAEKFHDPNDFAAEQDGKCEGRVQPFARGDRRAWKIRILDDIGNVGRLTAGPDPACQPYPRHERPVAARSHKLRGLYGFFVPHLDAAEDPCRPVYAP